MRPTRANDDRIEREIVIDAPPGLVWELLTDPDQITTWWLAEADFRAQPGANGSMTFKAERGGRRVPISVTVVEPQSHFSFRWDFEATMDPAPGNGTLVEFFLRPHGSGTHLRVIESGISLVGRNDTERADFRRRHSQGWDVCLGWMKAAADPTSTPLAYQP